MQARLAAVICAAAGLAIPASGQELVRVSYSWLEALTISGGPPVTAPNSVLDPGEAARISVNLVAMVNGTNAIGQTTTYVPPPPPGSGTIRGIGSVLFNLRGTEAAATGAWGIRSISPILGSNTSNGLVVDGGATVSAIRGSQLLSAGNTANETNPINNAFRGYWSPNSTVPRTVRFKVDADGLGSGAGMALAVQYGSALLDPNDPSTEYGLYTLKGVTIDDGGGIAIPIAPCPATAWLSLGLAVVSRRRRGR